MSDERSTFAVVAWGVALVFALQAGATLAVYIDHRTHDLTHVVRVYTSTRWLPDSSAAVRVGVLDARSGRTVAYESLQLDVEMHGAAVDSPVDLGTAFVLAHADVGEGDGAVIVELESGGIGDRTVRADVSVRDDVDWLREAETYQRPASQRRPNLSVAAGDDPRVTVRETGEGDECSFRTTLAVNGGVAAVGLENEAIVRVTESGAPVADLLLRIESPAGQQTTTRTDSLGSASLTLDVLGAERWGLEFDCRGETVRREIDIVPAWDGMLVRPTRPVYSAGDTFGFGAVHQRSWGDWHQDVYCDGSWLATQSTPILDRPAVLGMPDLRIGARAGGVRLCLVEGYKFLLSPDPPRSVSYFLWADAGVSVQAAIRALAESAARHGGDDLRGALGEPTLRALERARSEEVERFARWLLDALPQPFVPLPLAVDDSGASRAEFAAAHGRRGSAVLTVLAVDAVVLLLGVFGVLIPAAIRQRRALRAVAAELDDEAEPGLDGASRTGVVLVLGGLAIGASLLGIVVLLLFLR